MGTITKKSSKSAAVFIKPKSVAPLNFKVKKDLLKIRMRSISRTRYDRQLMARMKNGKMVEEITQKKSIKQLRKTKDKNSKDKKKVVKEVEKNGLEVKIAEDCSS